MVGRTLLEITDLLSDDDNQSCILYPALSCGRRAYHHVYVLYLEYTPLITFKGLVHGTQGKTPSTVIGLVKTGYRTSLVERSLDLEWDRKYV